MMAATLRQIGSAMTNVKSTRSIADRICGKKNAPRGDLFHRSEAKNGRNCCAAATLDQASRVEFRSYLQEMH
jgi:hypothetical protein